MKEPAVLFVSRITPFHSFGGMQSLAWDLARALAADGFRVSFLTTAIPGMQGPGNIDGVRLVPLEGTPPARYSRHWWQRSRDYFYTHLADSTDIVLSVSAGAYGIVKSRAACPSLRFVLQAHGTSPMEIASKWRRRRLKPLLFSAANVAAWGRDLVRYGKFDRIVAVGEAVHRSLSSPPNAWALRSAELSTIRNGVDTRVFRPDPGARTRLRTEEGWGIGDRIVILAQRLHPEKGADRALRGFAAARRAYPALQCVILGDGPQRAELEVLARTLGVAEVVYFKGAVDRASVARYLQASDIFLFPSLRDEGLPLSVLEALAVGLVPVVSPTVLASIPDLESCVLTAREPEAIAAALSRAAAMERPDAIALPAAYLFSTCVEQYEALFRDMVR